MKKIISVFALMLLVAMAADAQRSFKYKEATIANEDFEYPDSAGLIITCDASKPLSFESNVDASVEVFEQDIEGENAVYYIVLDAKEYRVRQLSVKSNGYYTLVVPVTLRNGFISRYNIYDPDDAVDGTRFQMHREKGLQYFNDCSYLAAKEQFELAKQCEDIGDSQRNEAQQHIDECDSLILWRRLGNEAADTLGYETALEYFAKAQGLNSQDQYVIQRYTECSNAISTRSERYLNAANAFFTEKEYEDAILMYQKVIDLKDSREAVSTAAAQRTIADRLLNQRKNATSSVSVEAAFGDNKLFGLSFGTYRNRTGGFFNIHTNKYLSHLISGDYNLNEKAEIDISFGWTVPIVKKQNDIFQGLYLHFGPGVTLLNKFSPQTDKFNNVDKNLITQEMVDEKLEANSSLSVSDLLSIHVTPAITPEIGLAVKVWRVLLRGSYIYRFAIDRNYKNDLVKSQWSVGLGWCY